MALTDVVMTVPEEMVPFVIPGTRHSGDVRNAMIMYPYARSRVISHGRAAGIIGISKRELIEIYL